MVDTLTTYRRFVFTETINVNIESCGDRVPPWRTPLVTLKLSEMQTPHPGVCPGGGPRGLGPPPPRN